MTAELLSPTANAADAGTDPFLDPPLCALFNTAYELLTPYAPMQMNERRQRWEADINVDFAAYVVGAAIRCPANTPPEYLMFHSGGLDATPGDIVHVVYNFRVELTPPAHPR